jgi:hypothetical protein
MMNLCKDKRKVCLVSAIIFIVIIAALGMQKLSSQTKELQRLREQRQEMAVLRDEFLSLQQKMKTVESRKNLANVQGVLQAVDEVFLPLGLKDRVKAVKSLGKKESKDGIEEDADVSVEKVTMNELLNILYRIEHAPMILSVRKVTIKQSFENPELLNMNLMLSFLKTG